MVARGYIKSILRSVKSSFSRFAAVFCIVALGVGFLAGLLSTTPDMRHSVDTYFKSTSFMDLQIMGNLGMCEDDVTKLLSVDGVNAVMPAVSADLITQTENGDSIVARVHSIDFSLVNSDNPAAVNRPVLNSGRWPRAANECVVEYSGELFSGISEGGRISFTADNKDLDDLLGITDYVIVGQVSSSYYLNLSQRGYTTVGNGKIGAILYLPQESFVTDYYTEIYITLEDSGFSSFSQSYLDYADEAAARVEALAETQKYVRRDAIQSEAEEKLIDAEKTLAEKTAEAEAELAEALTKLEEAQREVDENLAKLEDGQRDYQKGMEDLAKARLDFDTEIADAKQQIADGWAELLEGRAELDDGWAELLDGEAELEENRILLEDGRAQLAEAMAEFADAEKAIADGEAELEENRTLLKDGRVQLEDARLQLEDAALKLQEGREAITSAERALAAGKQQIEDGKSQLEMLATALEIAKDNRDILDMLIAQAGEHSPQGAVDAAQAFVDENADTVAEIKQRMAEENPESPVTAEEQALVALYDSMQQVLAQSDELLAELFALQDKYTDAQTVIDELESQYNSAAAQLADAEKQIADGEAQLSVGRAELRAGEREYAAGLARIDEEYARLEEGEAQLLDGEIKLREGREELEANRPELDSAIAEFAESEEKFLDGEAQLLDGRIKLEEGEDEYAQGLLDIQEAELELADGLITAESEFADAERKLRDAEIELADGRVKLEEGQAELADGWQEYYDAVDEVEEKLLEARDEITEARDKLRDIESPKWYVLTREANPGYVTYSGDSDKIESIARVFPIFFFLVATLVASTTMTRMVEEERGNIGTLKALGYSNTAISAKFFLYAAFAAVLGSVAGLAIGLQMFPGIIYNAYGMMYNLPPLTAADHALYGSLSAVAIFLGIMAATGGALKSSLDENAASLMRPKAPKEGKRIVLERVTFLWRRMKFTHKVTARNLLRYKKRFFMTVIGIFGCTALLLCGYGLRDSISDIVAIQFGSIFKYDVAVTLKHDGDSRTDPRISRVVDDAQRMTGYTLVHMETGRASTDQGSFEVTIVAPSSAAELEEYISLRQRKSGQQLVLGENDVLVSEKTASVLGLSPGDIFSLENSDETIAEFVITGIVENYVQGYIYMRESTYTRLFGAECEYKTILGNTPMQDKNFRDSFSEDLLKSPNVSGVSFTTAISETFDEMLETIDFIVIVLILCAAILAFVVMYNLTNINIAERNKELATLKVLGFTRGETAAYVFRETTILAMVGALAGLVGGVFLQSYIVQTVEVDNMMFGRVIKPISYVLSFFITMGFAAIVNAIMVFKIKAVDMVESLKAPE